MTDDARALLSDDSGATAVEYGLIAALLVIAIIGSLTFFASSTISMWDGVSAKTNAVTEKNK